VERNDPDGVQWPAHWQTEAIKAVRPYFDTDERLRITRDDPQAAIHGTVTEGHVYVEDGTPMIIFYRSGKHGIFPGS
jgi:hypothetical protein